MSAVIATSAMSRQPPTVFFVDDEAYARCLVNAILSPAGYAVETFADAEAALSRVRAGDRGCIAMDLKLPGMNGLELQRALRELGVTLPVLFISGQTDIPAVVKAMKQGAIDFLTKPIEPSDLLDVVARALREDEEAAVARATSERARARWATLSKRERQVCELLMEGMLNKQISAELGTTESTIQSQRNSAFKKLCVRSIVELVRMLDLVRGDGWAEMPSAHRRRAGCSAA